MSEWRVHSYHINVGLGDEAIHILAKSIGIGISHTCEKAIWIDGGTGWTNTDANFLKTIRDIENRYANLGPKNPLKFDVVIITHWDTDHHGGFTKYIRFDKDVNVFRAAPNLTRFYCPYLPTLAVIKDFFVTEKNVTYLRRDGKSLAVVYSTEDIIGTEFFTAQHVGGFNSARKISKLSDLQAKITLPQGQPGMYCIAANIHVIGDRQTTRVGPRFALAPEDSTKTNKSSIAAIIAWDNGRVSHYFAGDLDWRREALLVLWLGGVQIRTMKASHHGAKNSTPPLMIDQFKPRNIIISAEDAHGHPSWELILYITIYAACMQRLKIGLLRGPLLFTVFPSWMQGFFGGEGLDIERMEPWMFKDPKLIKDATQKKKAVFFQALMKQEDCKVYKVLSEALEQRPDMTGEDMFNDFALEILYLIDDLFADITTSAKKEYGLSELQYILITSHDTDLLDGTVSYKKVDEQEVKLGAPLLSVSKKIIKKTKPKARRPTKQEMKQPVNATRYSLRLAAQRKNKPPPKAQIGSLMSGQPPSFVSMIHTDQPDTALIAVSALNFGVLGTYSEGRGAAGDGENVLLLKRTDPLDDFVCGLAESRLTVVSAPTAEGVKAIVDDELWIWMKIALNGSDLTFRGSHTAITSLSFRMQGNLVFDTEYAKTAFGLDQQSTHIHDVGLLRAASNSVMVLGLSQATPKIDWTFNEILVFFNKMVTSDDPSEKLVLAIEKIVSDLLGPVRWILDTQALSKERNALWVLPYYRKLALRLAFKLANGAEAPCASLIKMLLPTDTTISVTGGRLICTHESTIVDPYALETQLSSNTSFSFVASVTASVMNSTGNAVSAEFDVILQLLGTGKQVLKIQNNNPKNEILDFATALVAKCAGIEEPSFDWPLMQSIKEALKFRQLQIGVENGSISEASLKMELAVNFGKQLDGSKPALSADVGYHKQGSRSSLALRASLWFPQVVDPDKVPLVCFSDWEQFSDLQPMADKVARSLPLASLLPESIDVAGLKDILTPEVTNAVFEISTESILVSGKIEKCKGYSSSNPALPSLDFKEAGVEATWNRDKRTITASVFFRLALTGPKNDDVLPATCSNQILGSLSLDTGSKTWALSASVQELYLGMLYQYFVDEAADLLYDVLKEIYVRNLSIDFVKQDSVIIFQASGTIEIAEALAFTITYRRQSKTEWSFAARLVIREDIIGAVTIEDLVTSLFGSDSGIAKDLPDFILAAKLPTAPKLKLDITKHGPDGVKLVFIADFDSIRLVFVQLQSQARKQNGKPEDPSAKPIRYFRLSFTKMQVPLDVPLISNFVPPFDELGFAWTSNKLGADDLEELEKALSGTNTLHNTDVVVFAKSDDKKKPQEMTAGFHFLVLSAGEIVLDYNIGKSKSEKDEKSAGSNDIGLVEGGLSETAPSDRDVENADDKSNKSPKQPFKKSQGPLTIDSLQLEYKDKVLSIIMDATFVLGPLTFALLGFKVGLDFKNGMTMDKIKPENIRVSIDGLAASLDRPPLTIQGGLVHKKTADLDMYAGGIAIGFVPWLFQAAGFYGKIKDPNSSDVFTSAFVYAALRGPLITLEFATISGITGGFGYNVGINVPKIEDVYRFPLLNPPSDKLSISQTLVELMKPATKDSPQWFFPQQGSMWLAAGLTVSAFEMLDVTAVLIGQWSPQLQFHLVGVASADIPNAKSPIKLAHVELGFLASIDTTAGLFSFEAQLSPNSYILHKNCHLSGGFALYYWFKTTSSTSKGDFVFTIGGYHNAFRVPTNYPRPPRLAISWAFNKNIAIRGEAYFAITPKACMAGLHITAVLTLGPLRAWFDAYADFLINYAPFSFAAVGHVSVGIAFSMRVWFIHISIEAEIGATLYLNGPPLVGVVHVDFWVFGFNISFGDRGSLPENRELKLEAFYNLALQTQAKSGASQPAQIFSCLGGLNCPESDKPTQDPVWQVSGGAFVFALDNLFPIEDATVEGMQIFPSARDDLPPSLGKPEQERGKSTISAKPMHAVRSVASYVKIEVSLGSEPVKGWRMRPTMKYLPEALWGEYDPMKDPGRSGNSIDDLLHSDGGCVRMMAGVEVYAPEAVPSQDKMLSFEIDKALLQDVFANDRKNCKNIPLGEQQSSAWAPKAIPPDKQKDQWDVIQKLWQQADAQPTVDAWTKIMPWGSTLKAARPQYLVDNFQDLYMQAPHECVNVEDIRGVRTRELDVSICRICNGQ